MSPSSFPVFVFVFWGLRRGGGLEADLRVHPAEGGRRPEAAVRRSRGAGLPAAGQPMARADPGPLRNVQREPAGRLSVRERRLGPGRSPRKCEFARFCLCVRRRSPAGMIEGTPQLHANAWKTSSACVAPVNQPIIDPCELNQNNGKSGHAWVFISGHKIPFSNCSESP